MTTPVPPSLESTQNAPDKKPAGRLEAEPLTTFTSLAPRPQDLAEDAIALVQKWLTSSAGQSQPSSRVSPGSPPRGAAKANSADTRSAELLANVLKDPAGLDFTLGFVDRVIRPEDTAVAARELERLSAHTPGFLPWYLKLGVKLGGRLAPLAPNLVVPMARAAMRLMVSHLIVDARPKHLGKAIASLRGDSSRLNINLLGEAVLGQGEADARLAGTRELLERDDVDYVSIKVSSVVANINLWAFQQSVDLIVSRLLPLYQYAARASAAGQRKFINLDMEEYHDLDLTVAVFTQLLADPTLANLEAGIVLQAYLPDSLRALQKLSAFARRRRAEGGAKIKVRVVKGANLAMERVDAKMHGWQLATVASKQEADTNYKRLLDFALRPENIEAVRIGVAGHNLFDIALAHLLAQARGVQEGVEFEMLLGMAQAQADEIRKDVGAVLLYTPVVHPKHFDVAISYLIRRLEENSSQENFMSAVFELESNPELFEREKNRFLASLEVLDTTVPAPRRAQSLTRMSRDVTGRFANQEDSDPALGTTREWAAQILGRVDSSQLGTHLIAQARLQDTEEVDAAIARALAAAPGWAQLGGSGRADVLRLGAQELSNKRGELIEVSASETGKTLAEADPEISEAIDFANYYADLALELDQLAGAKFVPSQLSVVTPPWNFPIAIAAGSILAPLAAGSAVIVKPAPQAKRSAAVVVQALWAAGIPQDVLQLVDVEEGPVGQHLIAHPSVDRVILTGAYETAKLFKSWREDLGLLAETSGKNALVVTPSADLDLAAADIVRSAFGHAGQKCSAASLAILVGSAATSQRLRTQIIDAASSLVVAYPEDPRAQMGPLIEPATGKLEKALTVLEPGEKWLVKPRQLDETGRLWTPGVKTGVQPGSYFHTTEFFGPVLGLMEAKDLDQAIEWQNGTDYGLTAGIHTLDPQEIEQWVEQVEAGNLYVNRGITGAIVRRQPFGGWKRSAIGPGAKAGGENYLLHLGSLRRSPLEQNGPSIALAPRVQTLVEVAGPHLERADLEFLSRAVAEDERQWNTRFARMRDISGLGVERNEFRYRPVPVTVRMSEGGTLGELLRVVAAGWRSGAALDISTATPLPAGVLELLEADAPSQVHLEDDAAFAARMRGQMPARIRLIGGSYTELSHELGGSPDVAIYAGEVTEAGRVELLPFLREQAIALTAHRFGNPDPVSSAVLN